MTRWSYVSAVPVSTSNSAADSFRTMIAGVGMVILFAAAVFALWIANGIAKPIMALAQAATHLSQGDVEQAVTLSRHQQALLEKGKQMAQQGAQAVARVLEDAIVSGKLTEAQVFDRNYQPIPNTNPQKYRTAYDQYADEHIADIVDAFGKDQSVFYSIAVDINGYCPTHNMRAPLTGDNQVDILRNRTKRIFDDSAALVAARNTEPTICNIYRRDDGSVTLDTSAPIWVRGQHWGGFRVGISLATVDETSQLVFMFLHLKNYLSSATATATRLAQGDLTADFLLRSDKDALGKAVRTLKKNVSDLVAETKVLTRAAMQGELGVRADPRKFQGGYRELVGGINETLDAVIKPLNVAAEYVDRISKGDIPPKITDEYYGDFNEIKHNLNRCIDELNGLVDDLNELTHAAVEGNLSLRDDTSTNQGVFRQIMEGINAMLDALVAPVESTKQVLAQVARGDLLIRTNGRYNGDFAILQNSIETMVGGLKGMAQQTQQGAVSMTSATAEILASSTQMASTTREQASAVNQVTSTVKEIKASAE
jgi:methyl-accepting chemotaxis protein